MYRGINEFKKVNNLDPIWYRMRGAIYLQILTKFWIGGRITSVSCWTYSGLVVLGRLKCTQPSHFCQSPVLKSYKSPGVDQNPAELIQAGGETLRSEIHKLIKLIWNKEELPHQWKESIVVPIHTKRAITLTVISIEAYHCCQLHTNFIKHSSF
jgi:hypothetical protein